MSFLKKLLPVLRRMGTQRKSVNAAHCKECQGEMRKGIAIGQTYRGVPDFPDGEVCTVSPGGTGKIISVNKCTKCGWSYTA